MNRRALFKLVGGLVLAQYSASLFASTANTKIDNPLLLNFNENSLGMSSKAKQAIIDSLGEVYRYPDSQREALIEYLAQYYAITDKQIALGNGSSETIQATVQYAAQQKGRKVQLVVPDPTFNYAELYAKPLDVVINKIPLTKELAFDIAAMRKAVAEFNGFSIIYLCNPNNPTATIMPTQGMTDWLKETADHALFLFDEAYAEYVTDPNFVSGLNYLEQGYKHVVVTRTFSKIYALAGLRLGYAIAHADVIAGIDSFISIDNTNLAAAVAGLASLHDQEFLLLSQQSNQLSYKIVTAALDECGIAYLPSQANFVFHKVNGDIKTYQQRMKEYNIWVGREFPPAFGWSRLTLGTPDEMARFVKVLKIFKQKGWV